MKLKLCSVCERPVIGTYRKKVRNNVYFCVYFLFFFDLHLGAPLSGTSWSQLHLVVCKSHHGYTRNYNS